MMSLHMIGDSQCLSRIVIYHYLSKNVLKSQKTQNRAISEICCKIRFSEKLDVKVMDLYCVQWTLKIADLTN